MSQRFFFFSIGKGWIYPKLTQKGQTEYEQRDDVSKSLENCILSVFFFFATPRRRNAGRIIIRYFLYLQETTIVHKLTTEVRDK